MAVAKSGKITVTTAGTAVSGPDSGPGEFLIKADPANTGFIYVGNDGNNSVSSTTGYKLSAGDTVVITTGNLNRWRFDASVNGENVR